MTIAACYLSPEGVIFGADSTSTMQRPGEPDQHYNHAQKVFEIGETGTLGMTMWGVGGLGQKSYRTMVAELSDDISANPPQSVQEAAERWKARFWQEYTTYFSDLINRYLDLIRIDPRTPDEDDELYELMGLGGGFCIGGRVDPNRQPEAYVITYGPNMSEPNGPNPLGYDDPQFWGVPNLIERVVYGIENELFNRIVNSGKWQGSPQELFELIAPSVLQAPGRLPLREAIDWVYSSIFITIKAMKFSSLAPVCGGPIEVATITSDRKFRWVTHKRLSEAVREIQFNGAMS